MCPENLVGAKLQINTPVIKHIYACSLMRGIEKGAQKNE
jgi:hypothetical protein